LDGKEPVLFHTISASRDTDAKTARGGLSRMVRHLAKDIGPRAPGSKGERAAARFVQREIEAAGLSVQSMDFRTPETCAWSKLVPHLMTAAGVALFPASGHLSYLLVVTGFLLYLCEEFGRSPLALLLPRRPSMNLTARVEPLREPRHKVVLLAHLDSPRSTFYYRPSLMGLYRAALMVVFLCHAAIFMLFTVAYGGHLLRMDRDLLALFWHLGLALAVPPLLAGLSLFAKAVAGRPTPGGNDNASGLAVLVEASRIYSRRRPHHVELWLAATGASDASGLGARRLVRKHRRDLRGAYFIVVEGVGRGFPVCFKREGRLLRFRANRRLTAVIKRVCETHVHHGSGLMNNRLYLGEGFQLLSRGHRAVTVRCWEDARVPRYWRWGKDDLDNVDPRSMRTAMDFVIAVIDAIDRGGLD